MTLHGVMRNRNFIENLAQRVRQSKPEMYMFSASIFFPPPLTVECHLKFKTLDWMWDLEGSEYSFAKDSSLRIQMPGCVI